MNAASTSVVVLAVEDDARILESMQSALEDGGYTVILAREGDEAIGFLNFRVDEIACLVTDICLGGGPSGWDVARHARELKPDIAVVYATGDSVDEWSAQGVPKSAIIQKPFVAAQLITAVSQLLTQVDSSLG